MPSQTDSPLHDQRTTLLLEAVEILVEELAILSSQDWERLPELKKKKVVAASRLRQVRAETEAADGVPIPTLEALTDELDALAQWHIRTRLHLIGNQMIALQDLSIYLRETQSVTLRRKTNRPHGNGGAVG